MHESNFVKPTAGPSQGDMSAVMGGASWYGKEQSISTEKRTIIFERVCSHFFTLLADPQGYNVAPEHQGTAYNVGVGGAPTAIQPNGGPPYNVVAGGNVYNNAGSAPSAGSGPGM